MIPADDDLDRRVGDIRAGSRVAVGRAITLLESGLAAHRAPARSLLAKLAPHAARAHRIGVSGVPGAGKSTLIDALGSRLVDQGHRVAVLAVDPSSARTGGSVLADTTRMPRLASSPAAYLRASPSAGHLGGVGAATRAALTVVEAAGYDIVLVETVGVGQSEIEVAAMVDTFLLVGLMGAGDELQGIKMGVLEVADVVVINKTDGDRVTTGAAAARQLSAALRLLPATGGRVVPPVLTCSARDGSGIAELWARIADRHRARTRSGELADRQRAQAVEAMWSHARASLLEAFGTAPATSAEAGALSPEVASGAITAAEAGDRLFRAFLTAVREGRPG